MDDMQRRSQRLNRLRSLGLRRGTSHIVIPPASSTPIPSQNQPDFLQAFLTDYSPFETAAPIETVLPNGVVVDNNRGQYFQVESRYPRAEVYGRIQLTKLQQVGFDIISTITRDELWHDFTWQDVLFVDLETTGLEIGAGTLAFLIGVGYVDNDDFVVRQFFIRDLDEEAALLQDLADLSDQFRAIVSFNGKTFDLPLLENRFTMSRQFTDWLDAPHFDLLHPSRRIWRRRLENCRLGTLEAELVGVQRTQADVPGYLIPSLYYKYLEDNDARFMAGIFYHNELDIVSMAALTAVLGAHFNLLTDSNPAANFHPIDILSVGLWHQHLGNIDQAEILFNLALDQPLPEPLQVLANTSLAYLLKRQNRYSEAEPLWQGLVLGPEPLMALEELAKYYEWQQKDFESALRCIEFALSQLAQSPASYTGQAQHQAWQHRRNRVQRKQTQTPSVEQTPKSIN